eukprot:jgi/Mesvir1/27998/Mv20194-RA.1
MGEAPRKVLLCGDPQGRLHTLFKRVAAVNKSNGPFDVVFCVGQFFPSAPANAAAPPPSLELLEYMSGQKEVPLPTYFIGGYGGPRAEPRRDAEAEGEEDAHAADDNAVDPSAVLPPDGGELCKNLYYLGRWGMQHINGLRVVYLSGRPPKAAPPHGGAAEGEDEEDEGEVERSAGLAALLAVAPKEAGLVDLLLTDEWPRGVLTHTKPESLPPGRDFRFVGDAGVATLAQRLQPRYIVAGREGIHVARDPYANSCGHVTRFLALAPVDNPAKHKWLHALSLVPVMDMDEAALMQHPPNTTPCPFPAIAGAVEESPAASLKRRLEAVAAEEAAGGGMDQFWRFDMRKRGRGAGRPGGLGRGEGGGRGGPDSGASAPGKVCFDFQKGACSRGDQCRYPHVMPGEAPPAGAPSRGGPAISHGANSGKVCFNFLKGTCTKGEACIYPHVAQQSPATEPLALPPVPGALVGWPGAVPQQGLLGPPPGGAPQAGGKVCFDFQKGNCTRGAQCRYVHVAGAIGAGAPSVPGDGRGRGLPAGRGGGHGGGGPQGPPPPCWFCLASPEVDAHLVASVGTECYMAVAKGALSPEHVLVLPIEHHTAMLALPSSAQMEMRRYLKALSSYFASRQLAPVAFERHLHFKQAAHAHVQVFAIPSDKAGAARDTFDACAKDAGFAFRDLPASATAGVFNDIEGASSQWGELSTATKGGQAQYFVAYLPDGSCLLHIIPLEGRHPLQFGRKAFAQLLGHPEKEDWKACKLEKQEETAMTERFKEQFGPFDIMEG